MKAIVFTKYGPPDVLQLREIEKLMLTRANQKDLVFLKELLETGKVVPVIDKCYPLGEVAQVIRYLLEGHARGKVVITNESAEA